MIGRKTGAALACLWVSAAPDAAEPFRIAHNQNLPPLYMVQDGKSVGLGIDVLRAAAGRAGIELAFVPLTIEHALMGFYQRTHRSAGKYSILVHRS